MLGWPQQNTKRAKFAPAGNLSLRCLWVVPYEQRCSGEHEDIRRIVAVKHARVDCTRRRPKLKREKTVPRSVVYMSSKCRCHRGNTGAISCTAVRSQYRHGPCQVRLSSYRMHEHHAVNASYQGMRTFPQKHSHTIFSCLMFALY